MLARWIACCAALLFAAPASAITVAGFGDSLTTRPSYLDFVSADTIVDVGSGGELTADGVGRLETWLTANDADFVILLEGTNDFFATGYDQSATAANLASMMDLVLADGAIPILLGPPPIIATGEEVADGRSAALAPLLSSAAATRGVAFVDLYDLFSSAADTASLYESDGIHPNTLGDQLIATRVNAVITPEPTTSLLLGGGLACLAARGPRRRGRHPTRT